MGNLTLKIGASCVRFDEDKDFQGNSIKDVRPVT